MKNYSRLLNTTFALLLVPAISLAGLGGLKNSSARFNAVGPGGLKIEGKTTEVQVSDDGTSVAVTVGLKNLDTGISLRNKHMREKYLEVEKYPTAVLRLPRAAIKFPAANARESSSATGQMTIHGQTRPVTVRYSAQNNAGVYSVSGEAQLNIGQFGVDVPSYLGVTVKPDVTVNVEFTVVDQ